MVAVLGIDAAWTVKEPSGVALVVGDGYGWRLLAAAPSYDAFIGGPGRSLGVRYRGSAPDALKLLDAAEAITGVPVDLVAVDMPLSLEPITGRRVSDNAVSSAYGAKHASTHTPSVLRPGRMSDDLRVGFERAGYALATTTVEGRTLVEVYPHPALIELAAAERRLPYKASKVAKYWPHDLPGARRQRLLETWRQIVAMLDGRIEGVEGLLSLPAFESKGYEMKAFEDMLDAVVCAWVGTCILEGNATAYGDAVSAIWVPRLTSAQGIPSQDGLA